jgi:hypothetical protein
MNTATNSEQKRPGTEHELRRLLQFSGREDRLDLRVDVAAGQKPAEPIVGERRPRLLEDERQHRHQHGDNQTDQRAEP